MAGKLILMGDGKVVYVPPRPLSQKMAEAIQQQFNDVQIWIEREAGETAS